MKKHNFNAGPSILPREVLEETSRGLLNLNNSGLSVAEISHRSTAFSDIIEEAEQLVRELFSAGSDYAILFLTGGASSQFFMTAMNLLHPGDKAAYIDTGIWSSKAINEAKLFGEIIEVASSKDKNYNYIPKDITVAKDMKYLHFTSNNTIFGTQFHKAPKADTKLICDMSSDIFSRPVTLSRYGMIYAGAQKNLGPAGTTIVIVDKNFVKDPPETIPTMLNYQTHIEKGSRFNTPPVIPIYMCMLTFRWLKECGGLKQMEKRNIEKAQLLYNEIDRNSLFYGPVHKEDRSNMNACFLMSEPNLESEFLNLCIENDIVGIKGHRSVGGFRASIYNALAKDSIQHLVEIMQFFEDKYG